MSGIVVIGGGQAGASLVAKLRSSGYAGPLTLLGEEPVPPYQRPPLSKAYLLGDMTLDRLYLRPAQFYADKDITLRTGAEVTALDPAAKTITVDGETLSYDQCALTTGSRPRRLPAQIGGDLDGVFVVRTLADVDAMAPEITEDRHALIVGGGYIGLEAAAVAAKRGLRVTLVEIADRILQRVAASETSDFFRALHTAGGVTVREGTGLTRLIGTDGRVTGARLEDGSEIDIDLVIVGTGIVPDDRLARAAGLLCADGIVVDSYGRTSDPSIWAAGDCANFPLGDKRMRLESVQNAIDQAEAVADNMLGAEEPYVPRPWFWSDQYDTKLQIAGLNAGYDRVVRRPGADDSAVSHWYYADDRLIAVDAMNAPRDYMVGKRMIEAGRSPDPNAVADPGTDLKALLK